MRAQPLSGAGLGSDGMRPRAIEAANKVILRNHRCCFGENVIVAGRLSPAREPHDGQGDPMLLNCCRRAWRWNNGSSTGT